MADKALRPGTISGLGKKLDEFSEVLTPEERSVLLGLLGAAGSSLEEAAKSSEAEGGNLGIAPNVFVPGNLPKFSTALDATFERLDFGGGGTGPLEDSVGVGVASVSWSKDYNMEAPGSRFGGGRLGTIPGMRFRR